MAGAEGDEAKVDAEVDETPLEVADEDALDGEVEAVLEADMVPEETWLPAVDAPPAVAVPVVVGVDEARVFAPPGVAGIGNNWGMRF